MLLEDFLLYSSNYLNKIFKKRNVMAFVACTNVATCYHGHLTLLCVVFIPPNIFNCCCFLLIAKERIKLAFGLFGPFLPRALNKKNIQIDTQTLKANWELKISMSIKKCLRLRFLGEIFVIWIESRRLSFSLANKVFNYLYKVKPLFNPLFLKL